jgi:outer membrane protein assembly factor BamB
MKRASLIMMLLALGAGCGGGASWRVQTTTPAAGGDWAKAFGAPVALEGGAALLFVSAERGVYATTIDGTRVWAVELPAGHRTLTLGGGKLIAAGEGHVAAYNAADGTPLWDVPLSEAPLSPPVIAGDKVLLVANHLLMALDAASGSVAWKQPIAVDNAMMRVLKLSRVAPAMASGKACAGLGFEFNVVDLTSGQKGVHGDASGGGVSASLAADDKACYLPQSRAGGEGANTVYAIDPTAARFSPLWSRDLGGDADDLGISNLLVDGDHLYAATNQRVVALDRATGKLAWQLAGAPVAPVSTVRGTRAASHAFIEGLPPVTALNQAPGSNFAIGDGKLFVAVGYNESGAAKDAVTALDALTGAYLGTLVVGGVIRDLAVVGKTLAVAHSDGLRLVPTGAFTPPPPKK